MGRGFNGVPELADRRCVVVRAMGRKEGTGPMRTTRAICLYTAALVVACAAPAAAQQYGTSSSSWEGATHEMQKRGPRSDIYGPGSDGRIIVSGSDGYLSYRRAQPPDRQRAYGYAPGYYR